MKIRRSTHAAAKAPVNPTLSVSPHIDVRFFPLAVAHESNGPY